MDLSIRIENAVYVTCVGACMEEEHKSSVSVRPQILMLQSGQWCRLQVIQPESLSETA